MDLVIGDIPENLPVPDLSQNVDDIPSWNQCPQNWLEPIFDFAGAFLHDDGCLMLMHSYSSTMKGRILAYARTFDFVVRMEWWVLNGLRLTSALDRMKMVLSSIIHFFITL